MLKCYSVKAPFLWEYVVFEQGIDDEGKDSRLFWAKARGKFFRNVFNRGMFAEKILKSFAPVVGLLKSSQVQLIAGVKE